MDLYAKGSVFDLERALNERLRDQVSRLDFDPDAIDELVQQQKSEHMIEPPELDLAGELVPVRQSERVVHDDGRFARIPFPQRYKVIDVVYEIKVSGEAELLDWSPQSQVLSFASDPPQRHGNKVVLKYSVPIGEGAGQIQQQIVRDIDMLKTNVAGLRQWASVWNASLDQRVRSALLHRAAELNQKNSLAQGFRIKL